MKRKYSYKSGNKTIEKEYSYIPVRYIIAILLTVFEVAAIIATVIALCYFVPYFYLAAYITAAVCIVRIITSDDNPEYKAPWLLVVIILPVAGFMLYLMFYSRTLKRKFIKRREELTTLGNTDDSDALAELSEADPVAHGQAMMLRRSADTHVYKGTEITYFPLGEDMQRELMRDLVMAEKFIYMEYFIIEEGEFWDPILEILKQKARDGLDVRVLFDDIGCMSTLPGNYVKILRANGINAAVFSRLRGAADSEFNNRNHRKITVIDGKIGYTGGINIADEYVNGRIRFGHWKDTAVRLFGSAVTELTRLFTVDFGLCIASDTPSTETLFPKCESAGDGYTVPFGDGPKPLYKRRVAKELIKSMLASATERVIVTTPYLIPGDDLLLEIESAAMRGVEVSIIVPHVPDKRIVFELTRSYYKRLIAAGVAIYEYTPGFIHAKLCVTDGKYATVSTVNLDHRSLAHHFENGVWIAHSSCIGRIEDDLFRTIEKSERITESSLNVSIPKRILRTAARIFSPLM